jgi:hypothetical protein
MAGRIVIAGSLAQRAFRGGHAWVFLQYLLGFRRLGWDVLFLDRLEPGMVGNAADLEKSDEARYLVDVMERFGLGESFGRSRRAVLDFARGADLVLDFMGFSGDEVVLGAARRAVFMDIDPGFGQLWKELGLHDPFAGYDDHVTVGVRIGEAGCAVPTCGHRWIPIRPPVVLDRWAPASTPSEAPFTTVATWRGDFGPIDFGGRRMGLRAHEFRKFVELPLRTNATFEVAMDIHPDERPDLALLARNRWCLTDPKVVAAYPGDYASFIRRSRAELMVAKNLYVETASGWFSDRSACYLASGKPVLAQDTGLRGRLPSGDGLLLFRTLDEAAAAVESVLTDPDRHREAAREIAVSYFDSDRVLQGLLEALDGTADTAQGWVA